MVKTALDINRGVLVAFGFVGLLMMLFALPFFLSSLGILGTGTLLATLVGLIFVSSIRRGNAWGARAAMAGGFVTSGGMLLFTDSGWLVGLLTECLVSTALYVVVSLATFGVSRRVKFAPAQGATAAE